MSYFSIKNLFFISLSIVLTSCLKEYPVPSNYSPSVGQVQLEMGETYKNQVYFDLENNNVVAIKDKDAWDIAFARSDTTNHLILNSAKIMGAIHLPNHNLDDQVNTATEDWIYESPEGHYNESPFYQFDNKSGVYLINGGMNYLGQHQGFYTLSATMQDESVHVEWRRVGTTETQEIVLNRNTAYNYVGLNLTTATEVEIEPPFATWDLKFSVYTHIFDGHSPYSVVGVLLNPNHVSAEKTELLWNAIQLNDFENANLSYNLNIIGYDWKEFNFDQNIFEVFTNFTYLIQSRNGYYFAIRFIDFYNANGVKGFPTFEVWGE
jgi:hypothetical protein